MFEVYGEALRAAFRRAIPQASVLRSFEKRLLAELGYAPLLEREAVSGEPIEPSRRYVYEPDRGPMLSLDASPNDLSVSGQTLLDLAADEFSRPETRDEARMLLRSLIGQRLHGKVLHTRAVLRELTRPMIELGVNVDHVATVRQARRTYEPDPVWAAIEAHLGGADGITVHLREDRRHIQDEDVRRLRELTHIKLNLEMAATDEMVGIAARIKPEMAMLVPEGRHEVTTEGGLDVVARRPDCARWCRRLRDAGIVVSVFIDAERAQVEAAKRIGASVCEIHTGPYAHAFHSKGRDAESPAVVAELEKIKRAGERIRALGMRFNAGHALNYFNVQPVARAARRARAAHRPRHRLARGVRRHARGGARDEGADGARPRGDLRGRDRRGRDRPHRKALERWGERFAERILSPSELKRFKSHRQPANYLAKRFAAKEAFTKALGTGIKAPANWHGVWVVNQRSGKPELAVLGTADRASFKPRHHALPSLARRRARHRRRHRDPGMRKVRLPPGPVVADVVGTGADRRGPRAPAAPGRRRGDPVHAQLREPRAAQGTGRRNRKAARAGAADLRRP